MCLVTLVLIFFALKVTTADISAQVYEDSYSKEVLDFALSVYQTVCKDCRLTTLISDKYDITPNWFLRNIQYNDLHMPFTTISINSNRTYANTKYYDTKSDLYLIFMNGYVNNITEIINNLGRLLDWNRSAITVLIVRWVPSNDTVSWIYETFQLLWKKRILHTCLCSWMDNKLRIHTFNPFTGDYYATDVTGTSYTRLKELLEFKQLDLYGYPMKTYVYDVASYSKRISKEQISRNGQSEYIGLDGMFLTVVRDKLNATLSLQRETVERMCASFLIRNNNDTALMPSAFLVEYNLDTMFTAVREKMNVNAYYAHLQERDDFCVVVPRAGKIPQYLHIFLIVPVGMWIGTFVSMLVVAVTLHLMHRRTALLDVCRVLFSPPVRDSPRMCERYVVASWILFCFIFTVVFQCTLTSTLVAPKYYRNIETMQELAESNISIYASIFDLALLKQNLDASQAGVLARFISTPAWTLEEMLSHQQVGMGFMMRSEIARKFMKLTKDRGTLTYRYHVMRERAIPSAQGYAFVEDHPYLRQAAWIIDRIHETGIYYHWRKVDFGWDADALTISQNAQGQNVTISTGDDFISLSIVHLQSAFYLLLLGLSIATIAFLVERFK